MQNTIHDDCWGYGIIRNRLRRCKTILGESVVGEGALPFEAYVYIVDDNQDDNWHQEEADLEDYDCVVVACKREGSTVVIYALIGYVSRYGPMVLVKGTMRSFVREDSQLLKFWKKTKYSLHASHSK